MEAFYEIFTRWQNTSSVVISEDEADAYQQAYLKLMTGLSAVVNEWPENFQIDCDNSGPIPRVNLSLKLSALYSQFTEHIGGVIYDGIWVGPDSKVANTDGIRTALVEHVRRLGKVLIRWPGGCFADRYHWRDGIGPRDRRPRRFGRWQEVTEPNHFGTHEFMRFCRLCGAEPYFAANVGSGSVE